MKIEHKIELISQVGMLEMSLKFAAEQVTKWQNMLSSLAESASELNEFVREKIVKQEEEEIENGD